MDGLHSIDGHVIDLAVLTNYYLLGSTDSQVAFFLGVDEKTLKRWISRDPIIAAAVLKGGAIADSNVAAALYRCAIGFKGRDVKVVAYEGDIKVVEYDKWYLPDVGAAKTWLSKRQPEIWGPKADSGVRSEKETERASKADAIRKKLESKLDSLFAAGKPEDLAKRPVAGRA